MTATAIAIRPLIDDFTRAYVECALWSTTDESTPAGGEPMDDNYSLNDIETDTLTKMAEDCTASRLRMPMIWRPITIPAGAPAELGGHDFWLTRNHHGAGFWDRDHLDELARDRLTDAANKFRDFDLYVGDDGKIYGC